MDISGKISQANGRLVIARLGILIQQIGDRPILVLQPNKQPQLFSQNDHLIVLPTINSEITVREIFDGLRMSR